MINTSGQVEPLTMSIHMLGAARLISGHKIMPWSRGLNVTRIEPYAGQHRVRLAWPMNTIPFPVHALNPLHHFFLLLLSLDILPSLVANIINMETGQLKCSGIMALA